MELDEFKNTWNEMGHQANEKQPLPLATLDRMGRKKMYSVLKKIILPEILGSAVCIGSVVFIGFNFYKLDQWPYQVSGILAMVLFIILSAISLMSIQQLSQPVDAGKTYADTLRDFAAKRIKFCKLQKLNVTLCYLLFVTVILILPKIFGTNSLTGSKYFYLYAYMLGYSLILMFSKWVFKSYNNTIRQTEQLLQELAP